MKRLIAFVAWILAMPLTGFAQVNLLNDPAYESRYRDFSPAERARADRLLYLTLYDRKYDLQSALRSGTELSRSRAQGITTYREVLNKEWYREFSRPSRAMVIPPPPPTPETLPKSDPWSYPSFLQRSMSDAYAGKANERDAIRAGATILEFVLGATAVKTAARVPSKILKLFPDDSSKPILTTEEKVRAAYHATIDAVARAKNDKVFDEVLTDFVRERYGDNQVVEQILFGNHAAAGDAQISRVKPSDLHSSLEARQAEAIRKIKDQIEADKQRTTTSAGFNGPEDPDERAATARNFDYYLDEFTGASQLAVAILQFSDKQGARNLAVTTKALSDVGKLYSSYNKNEIGPLAFAGGYATVFVTLMQASQSQREQQALVGMLQEIGKALAALGEQMRTGFDQIDSKLDSLFALSSTGFANLQVAVDTLTDVSVQLSNKVDEVSLQIDQAEIARVLATHRGRIDDVLANVDKACYFVDMKNAVAVTDCKRMLLLALLIESRRVASALLTDLGSKQDVLFVSMPTLEKLDPLLSMNLEEIGSGQPQRLIGMAPSIEPIPPGYPSMTVWLRLMKQMRMRTEINGFRWDKAERVLLAAIAEDADALEVALGRFDKAHKEAWETYFKALQDLDSIVRKTLRDHQIMNGNAGVPYAIWDFCTECKYDANFKAPLGYDNPYYPPGLRAPWSTRNSGFTNFEALFAARLAQSPKDARGNSGGRHLSDKPKATLVRYDSLPQSFRDHLNIPNIEKLSSWNAGRLYAILNNERSWYPRFNEKKLRWDVGGCDDVAGYLGDTQCAAGRLTGMIEIVFASGPWEKPEFIDKILKEDLINAADFDVDPTSATHLFKLEPISNSL